MFLFSFSFLIYLDGKVNVEKRLVLQSHTDLLAIITNLTDQVKDLSNNQVKLSTLVSSLTSNASKQEIQSSVLSNQVTTLSNNQASVSAIEKMLTMNLSKQEALVSALTINLSKQEAQIGRLKNDIIKLQSGISCGGSTYIRWGKKRCPGVNGTTLLYSGYAGGSFYSNTGAAANHICLSPDPIWDHYTNTSDALARVYGVQYEFRANDADKPRHTAFFGKSLDNQDAPCSVCQSPRTKFLMIPGRNACYSGWTLEYSGYLVAGFYGHSAATEYICLDKDPEFNVGGYTNDDGARLYFVEAICGSLKCPPYVNGRELTCAVCTK